MAVDWLCGWRVRTAAAASVLTLAVSHSTAVHSCARLLCTVCAAASRRFELAMARLCCCDGSRPVSVPASTSRRLRLTSAHLRRSAKGVTCRAGPTAAPHQPSSQHHHAAGTATDWITDGVSLTVYPPDDDATPFDAMAFAISRAFATYEPSLWTYGARRGGRVSAAPIEWSLARTMRLMSAVERADAYVCRDECSGSVISSVFLLENAGVHALIYL
jgi:hypothetical protein